MTSHIDHTSPVEAAEASTSPLVSVSSVHKRFGSVVALDDVTIDIARNEFFSLLGPSGCGKTTLLRILAGLEVPDDGTVTLDGADLVAMPTHRRPVNLMFQSYALFPHLNVERNVSYGLEREKLSKSEIRPRVQEALETVGLSGLGKRRPAQLSGGQRQRVALARAIVKRPSVLLLDEPLGALDKQIRTQMQRELKRLQSEVGITFIVVTHDQEEAMSMADRIAVLRDGHVEQIASPNELYEHPASRFVAEFIGSTNLFESVNEKGSTELHCLRPERLQMGLVGEHPAGHEHVEGVLADVQFYGGLSHCYVDVAGRENPLIVASVGSVSYRPAQAVAVWWHPDSAVLLGKTGL